MMRSTMAKIKSMFSPYPGHRFLSRPRAIRFATLIFTVAPEAPS
jgi:hypothetical protein